VIVKVGLDGQVTVDRVAVSLDELVERVEALVREDGVVTYYREQPEMDGTPEASETFARLLRLRPKIQLGLHAPPEWGRLDWVEVEEAPFVSRVFLARGQKFLISAPATPEVPRQDVLVGGPLSPEHEDSAFAQIDLLISSDRIIETPYREPEQTMVEETRKQPSLHLRIGHDRGRWASWYPIGEVPSNVASFHADLWRFAHRFIEGFQTRRPVGPDEASQLFR
jgi:hypothetical protein